MLGDIERFVAELYPYRWPLAIAALITLAAVIGLGYRRSWQTAAVRYSLAAGLVAAALLVACGGGDGNGETATVGETPTAGETAEADGEATPTPDEGTTPEAAPSPIPGINWCDLVTPEEVEEALGKPVAETYELGDLTCRYNIAPRDTVQIEQGTQQIFEEGIYGEYAAAGREPVSGIGDEAAWFGRVAPFFLAVRQGDVYFQVALNLYEEVDSETQLEIAKELA
jgi:hypothetical protein